MKRSKFSTTPTFGKITSEEYKDNINSPGKSLEYFLSFHKPLITELKKLKVSEKITILDIACGYANEFEFMKDDKQLHLIGVDISEEMINEARRKFPDAEFFQGDIEIIEQSNIIHSDSIDLGMAINALIYKPDRMFSALYFALKHTSKCVVNFRNYSNPHNKAFFDYYLNLGCKITDREYLATNNNSHKIFPIKLVDYRFCNDKKYRNLDRQIFFTTVKDIEEFIFFMGFSIENHQTFSFVSKANAQNEHDVFTLKKQ